jgi:chromosome segregation ATPase
MEGVGIGVLISLASLLLTGVGLHWKRDSDYVAGLERRIDLGDQTTERLEEDVKTLKAALGSSERQRNQQDRLISDLYAEIREKDREIARLKR